MVRTGRPSNNKYFCKRCNDRNWIIECKCGCGQIRTRCDYAYNIREYIDRHQNIGRHHTKVRKHSEETKRKISESITGEKNPQFGKHHSIETRSKISKTLTGRKIPESVLCKLRSDNVGYSGVHKRVKKKFPRLEHKICMLCLKAESQELACITSILNDELKNWAWFCTKCHYKWDNISARNKIKRKLNHAINKSIFNRLVIFYVSNLNLIILLQHH